MTIFKETTTLVKELNEICYCTCKEFRNLKEIEHNKL